jgi:hypothetical protein
MVGCAEALSEEILSPFWRERANETLRAVLPRCRAVEALFYFGGGEDGYIPRPAACEGMIAQATIAIALAREGFEKGAVHL